MTDNNTDKALRTVEGPVVSNKMDKTVTVLVERQVKQVALELVRRLLTHLLEFHQRTVRVTKVVVTESLAAARRNASRATASSTPSIS